MCKPSHPLTPDLARITHIVNETADIKTFRVVWEGEGAPFSFEPGQCAMLGVPGVGEAMFSISSSPGSDVNAVKYYDFSIKAVGGLTRHLHSLKNGAPLTLRGAYGRPFPINEALKGNDLLFIAGGIGLAPLRSVIQHVFENPTCFGTVDIVYGVRSVSDFVFKEELEVWKTQKNTQVFLTVDKHDLKTEAPWNGNIGFVPSYIKELSFSPANKRVLLCGPPIMIKYTAQTLLESGFNKQQIFTTLEMRMKCGIGKCGRCNIGHKMVCTDGPVFRLDELNDLPEEF